ncbi:ParA family protein [Thioalbus denitrificans]|uniref:Chromosome segregation ATPase n=1 Tax=Thioalbus denitrificans TaxID=547122 RepID=A0A369CGJ1_9GAMM|nr:AAA family ATPase [Thioalbus denitrificans]RCX32823.1 chromosome segregation ATPase [Thioalbus denitrificans]
MGRIIAVTNQKGGVGKTTTCVNLAASLAEAGRTVLLVDMDPQGNATQGCGVPRESLELTSYDVLLGEAAMDQALLKLDSAPFHLLPANGDLTGAEVQLLDLEGRERRLRHALGTVRARYDYIIIDCPPALNMLTVNALVAADAVLIPMQCEYYALEGLTALMNTIEKIRAAVNPGLEIEGLLRTMYDPRNRLAIDVSRQLIGHFGDRVYRTVVPRNVRLAEAPSHGLPALVYDRLSRGSVAYMALAGEMLRRHEAAAEPAGTGTG